MAAIKSRGTKTTELALKQLLRRARLFGWRSNAAGMPGRPDFVFPKAKLAVFVDGCFWHGCKKCSRQLTPVTNVVFWKSKIENNKRRDARVVRHLQRLGWGTVRIWEHDLKKNPAAVILRISRPVNRLKIRGVANDCSLRK